MEALGVLRVFKMLMKRGVFVTFLGVSYIGTFTNMHIVVFFLNDMGFIHQAAIEMTLQSCFTEKALQKHLYKGGFE